MPRPRRHAYAPDETQRTRTDAQALNLIAAHLSSANRDLNRADHLARLVEQIDNLVQQTGRPTDAQPKR
jgi:hypothetical protein